MERISFNLLDLWWEYLDWTKEARIVVDHIKRGRFNFNMRVLLNFIDQSIQEAFGWREFSLSSKIVEHSTLRFRDELKVVFDTIAQRNSLRGKQLVFDLEASTSSG